MVEFSYLISNCFTAPISFGSEQKIFILVSICKLTCQTCFLSYSVHNLKNILIDVFSYQCDNYVFNDNCHGEVALIRETLKEIETQIFSESLTRSGCVIRNASTPLLDEESK